MNLLPDPTPTPEPIKVTPWQAMLAAYIEASCGMLRHSQVCPETRMSLQFMVNKRGNKKFRLVCQCGAQCELPTEPDWATAWDKYLSKTIQEGVSQ